MLRPYPFDWRATAARFFLIPAAVGALSSCTAAPPQAPRLPSDTALARYEGPEFYKPRVIVLTDIGNEPDDSMSMVRFLLYSNELDVEGLIATTSTWLRDRVSRDRIEERVDAYAQVLPNLRAHAEGYPDAELLRSKIRAGRAAYGVQGVGRGMDTDASRLIIDAVDADDPRPVWITVWGGAVDLAQALFDVGATRNQTEVARFVSKLRVYSISDQDDAGPWIRARFPELFWITSVHAFGQYGLASWIGIARPLQGEENLATPQWLADNVQSHGPLGAVYPDVIYTMEGDSPSFIYLIPTGLGAPEHPDWGSWGGRYGTVSADFGLWSSAADAVPGAASGSGSATVSRWHGAYQRDFAARMDWSVTPDFSNANHRPAAVLNGEDGRDPIVIETCAENRVTLSAEGSSDRDGDALTYAWFQYREASGGVNPREVTISARGAAAEVRVPVTERPAPNVAIPDEVSFHVILQVTDNGDPVLTSYRRAIIRVPTAGTPEGNSLGCAQRAVAAPP
jgi:hypothetical protein